MTVDSTGTVWIASGSDQAGATGQWLIAKSSNHWATFTEANTGIALPPTTPFVALAVAPSDPATAYASIGQAGASEAVALWKTTDGSQTWTQLTNTPDYTGGAYSYGDGVTDTSEQGAYDNVVAVDPAHPDRVIAGGIGLVQSVDGGATWSNVNGAGFLSNTGTNLLHPDMHALYFTNGKVLVGNDGGIWLYDPSTKQVTDLNGNLDITQFYPGFSVMNGELLAGAQDNATALYMGKANWTGIWSGDGGPSALVPNDPNMAFFQADSAVAVTTDGFQTLNQLNSPSAVPPNFTVPLQVVPNSADPSAPSLYVGWGDGLYVTTDPADAKVKWTNLTPGEGHGSVSALAVSGATIYVGFDDGTVMVSTDGGNTVLPSSALTLRTTLTFRAGLIATSTPT